MIDFTAKAEDLHVQYHNKINYALDLQFFFRRNFRSVCSARSLLLL